MFSQNSVAALQTEFDKLSKILGASEVRTQFNGEGAYTNGKMINLPAMDMTKVMTPKDQAIARGYHIHEVGHITDTDFSIASAKKPSKKLHPIWNACEDVMIERKAIEKFSGAKRSLSAVVDSVLGNENEHWQDNPEENEARREKWWTEVPYAALQQARKDAGYESDALDTYIDDMPKLLAKEARRFAKDMAAAADTAESYELAKKISRRVAALQKEHGSDDDGDEQQQQPKVPQPNQQGEDDGDGTKGDSQQGDGDDQSDDQSDDQGDGQGDDDGDGDGDDKTKAQPKSGGFTMGDAEKRQKEKMNDVFSSYSPKQRRGRDVGTDFCEIYDTHNARFKDADEKCRGIKHPNAYVARDNLHRTRPTAEGLEASNRIYRESIKGEVNAYGARLARLLMSQESRRNEGGYSSGRIDRRRLSQLVAGNQNIFARTEDVKTSETRIMLAVDGSSSMRSLHTCTAIHVVNDALGRAGVKFDVTEWAGLSLNGVRETVGHLPSIVVHKTAHQNYRSLQKTLNFQPVGGDTPSYSALLTYAKIMSEWTEPRKILLMVTDGEPNGWTAERHMCRDLVKQMEASGIEVIGIGIGMDVSSMFDKHIETDFNKLGSTLLGSLEKLLISQGHAHAA